MIFKVIFADGSVEMVQAGNVTQARLNAIQGFPDRVVAKVTPADLSDMMLRREPPEPPKVFG